MEFVIETDRYGTRHFNVKNIGDAEDTDFKVKVKEAINDFKYECLSAISINFPMEGITMGALVKLLPENYPIDIIRDSQNKLFRFVYDPENKIPRGGNRDVGAMAFIVDSKAGTVLVTKNRWNGRLQYPGGRCDISETFFETAAREAKEEVGVVLDPEQGQIVGIRRFPNNQFAPGVNFFIRFIIPGASETMVLKPDGEEVSEAFWMPIKKASEELRPTLTEFIQNGTGWTGKKFIST